MLETIEANWPVIALVVGLVLVLLLFLVRGRSKVRERHRAPDALDQGAAPAQRNQALIDAPSAVTVAKAGGVGVLEREPEPVAKPAPPPSPPPPPPVEKEKRAPAPKSKAAPRAKTKAPPPAAKAPVAKPKAKAEIKAAPAPAPKPKSAPPPPPPALEPAPPTVQSGGDLARIKGLGPKLQTLLPTLGVAGLADVAAWSEADIDRIDAQLGVFAGRIRKDNWVEQAKLLAAGDTAGFEARFGKL